MTYTLVKEITKTGNNPWFIEMPVIISIDPVPDPRDRSIYNEFERNLIFNAVRVIKEGIEDYIGWKREYINDNQLNISYIFESEASARLFHTRATQNPPLPEVSVYRILQRKVMKQNSVYDVYTTSWKLYDLNGNTMEL